MLLAGSRYVVVPWQSREMSIAEVGERMQIVERLPDRRAFCGRSPVRDRRSSL